MTADDGLDQRFATLEAVSNGRAEVIVGRGSFTESVTLFGLPLDRYEKLFEEKLELFAALLAGERVSWQGSVRPPLVDATVHPRTERPIAAWVGIGGSPQSVVRAAHHGLPVLLAIIGATPHASALTSTCSPGRWASSGSRLCRSASTRRDTSRPVTARLASAFGRTIERCTTASARSAAGRR